MPPRLQAPQEEDEEERAQKVLQQCTRKIRTLGGKGRVKEAIQELANLAAVNVQPDTYAATALVQACSTKDMELAQSVFDELFGACSCGGGGGPQQHLRRLHA